MTFRAALSRFLASRPIAFIGRHPVAISNIVLWALELWTHQWDGQAVANHHATLTAAVAVITKLGRKWLPTVMPVDVAGKEIASGLWSEFHPAVVCDDENVAPAAPDKVERPDVLPPKPVPPPPPPPAEYDSIRVAQWVFSPDDATRILGETGINFEPVKVQISFENAPAKKRQPRAKAKKRKRHEGK